MIDGAINAKFHLAIPFLSRFAAIDPAELRDCKNIKALQEKICELPGPGIEFAPLGDSVLARGTQYAPTYLRSRYAGILRIDLKEIFTSHSNEFNSFFEKNDIQLFNFDVTLELWGRGIVVFEFFGEISFNLAASFILNEILEEFRTMFFSSQKICQNRDVYITLQNVENQLLKAKWKTSYPWLNSADKKIKEMTPYGISIAIFADGAEFLPENYEIIFENFTGSKIADAKVYDLYGIFCCGSGYDGQISFMKSAHFTYMSALWKICSNYLSTTLRRRHARCYGRWWVGC